MTFVRHEEATPRRVLHHVWIAALVLSIVGCLQAGLAQETSGRGRWTAERVLSHTAPGSALGEVLAGAEMAHAVPDVRRTVGEGREEVPEDALLGLVVLMALLLSPLLGSVSGIAEAALLPRPGVATLVWRAGLASVWLVPLCAATSAPGDELRVAVVATLVTSGLAALTQIHLPAVAMLRVAAVAALVWHFPPPLARVVEAQPIGPSLGDVKGLSRLVSHEEPPRSHHPDDDWLDASADDVGSPSRIVVVGIDTLGANHLSTHGYERPTFPRVQAMAREEGIVFERNHSSAPWTLPSTTSLFTSLHPHQHGVEDDGRRLHADVPTLAGAFASQGWHTAALVTHMYVSSRFGLDSGFHEFWELSIDFDFVAGHQLTAEQLNDRAIPWIREHQDEKFLLYLHYFDPHWDYEPPAPFSEMFTDASYEGPADGTWAYMGRFGSERRLMDPAALAECVGLYDGEIAYTDHHLGELFDEMKRLGIWDDALVVIVADHGEELQEHDSVGHGVTLYEEQIWVPLIVKLPGGRPEGWRSRVGEQTRSVDVAPTLLDVAALKTPPGFVGESLVPLMREPGDHRDTFSRTIRSRARLASVTHNRWKLIRDLARSTEELYDLEGDPSERNDLIEEQTAVATDLRARLDRVLEAPDETAGGRFVEDVELSDEERRALEALGYVD